MKLLLECWNIFNVRFLFECWKIFHERFLFEWIIFLHEKRDFLSPCGQWSIYMYYINTNETRNHFTFTAKGAIYYVTIATVDFSRVKITCYFQLWRYICYLPAGRSVKWKTEILKCCRGRRPRAAFSTPRSQIFSIRTDPKPVTYTKKHSRKKTRGQRLENRDRAKNQSDCRIRYRAHVRRYHVFARKLTWHLIGVYIYKQVVLKIAELRGRCFHVRAIFFSPFPYNMLLSCIPSLSLLVKSVKSKTGQFHEQKKKKKIKHA